MSNIGADATEDFSNLVNGGYLIVGIVVAGVLVYVIYEVYEGGVSLVQSIESFLCSFWSFSFCAQSPNENGEPDATYSDPSSGVDLGAGAISTADMTGFTA
jgi:hypothetical protein